MKPVTIRIGDRNQTEPLFPEYREIGPDYGEPIAVAILEDGTHGGQAALWFVFENAQGVKFSAQMTEGQFETIGGALRGARARWNGSQN